MAGREGVDLQVVGMGELIRALRAAEDATPKAVRDANRKAAELAVPFVRAAAPRGPHQGGGKVRPIADSIRAQATQRAGFVVAGGARTPHAGVLEWGGAIPRKGEGGYTRKHVRGGRTYQHGGNVTRVAAQPYLRPGIERALPAIVGSYLEDLDRMLDQVTG